MSARQSSHRSCCPHRRASDLGREELRRVDEDNREASCRPELPDERERDLEPAEAVAGDEAGRYAGDPGQELAQTQHRLPSKSVQQEQSGKVGGNLEMNL